MLTLVHDNGKDVYAKVVLVCLLTDIGNLWSKPVASVLRPSKTTAVSDYTVGTVSTVKELI